MNRFFAMLLLLPLACIGQTHYEKGYFIDDSGKKTECLIRNKGWNNNPTSFEYKISEDAENLQRDLKNTSEFAIDGEVKYRRETVKMERSSQKIGDMQHDARFTLSEETHFFKCLYDGSNSLYVYEENGLLKFFNRTASGDFYQLIHIIYTDNDGALRRYNQYYSQLLADFSCPGSTLESMSKLEYTATSLIKYYQETSACKGEKVVEAKKNKGDLNLRPFIGYKSLKFEQGEFYSQKSFSTSQGGLAYGLELEYILPTYRNKWAVLIAFEHNSIKEKHDLPDGMSSTDKRAEIKFSSFQVPVGGRYYGYLSDDFKLYAEGLFVLNFVSSDSEVEYNGGQSLFDHAWMEGNSYNFGLGIGISYKKLRNYKAFGIST